MKLVNDVIQLSAGDLSSHIACIHLTYLDLSALKGQIEGPVTVTKCLQFYRKEVWSLK